MAGSVYVISVSAKHTTNVVFCVAANSRALVDAVAVRIGIGDGAASSFARANAAREACAVAVAVAVVIVERQTGRLDPIARIPAAESAPRSVPHISRRRPYIVNR